MSVVTACADACDALGSDPAAQVATQRRRRSESGAAAVEFALIVPFLIFLLFAIIGYGYMLSFRQALSQAASEGARAAAVSPSGLDPTPAVSGADSVQTRVIEALNQSLGSYGVTCTASGNLQRNNVVAGFCTIAIDEPCSKSTTSATCAKVTLDYTYQDDSLLPSVPGLGVVLPDHLVYTAEVEMS